MKKFVVLILTFLSFLQVIAQKLPNIQQVGLRAPAKVKTDGKLTEWGGALQAYNNATKLEYTVANNGEHLYFAIGSKDVASTAKILLGGITFSFNAENKKNTNGLSLTFPHTGAGYSLTQQGSVKSNFETLTDPTKISDAIKGFKLIKVERLAGHTDTLISVYNDLGIQTQLLYGEGTLVFEIAIPLTFLKLTEPAKPFAYQVKLNGAPPPELEGGPPPPPPTAPPDWRPSDPRHISFEALTPTYFWGEYTLAK